MKLPRSVRARLQLVIMVALAAALGVMIVGFNILLWHGLSSDADTRAQAIAGDETDAVRVAAGAVTLAEAGDRGDLQSQVWVFSGTQQLKAPRTDPAIAAAARSLAGASAQAFMDVSDHQTRLFAMPLTSEGHRVGVIVAGVSLAPYERTRRIALIGSLLLAGGLLVIVGIGTRWLLVAALRPVARMTADAEAWSSNLPEKRFVMGEPYDEVSQLAATLDALLDRLAASLRREQRFSAELSHELRTPLARISAEAELALRRTRQPTEYEESLETILRSTRQMTQIVDTLMAASQQETGLARGRADARSVMLEVVDACSDQLFDPPIQVLAEPSTKRLTIGVDADVAVRILQPIVENACHFAARRVSLSLERAGSQVVFAVRDDGPGVTGEERERIFEPGFRGTAGEADSSRVPGAGLGLALARRLARAAAGDVETKPNPEGGGWFIVRLPMG